MQRVLLDDLEDDTEIGVQPTNGYRTIIAEHTLDPRSAASKRANHKHKPRRNRTAFTRRIGPYSRPAAIVELDGRTKEALLMARVRDELTAHVGGNPTAVERILIERAVMLSLRCAQLDIKIMSGEVLTQHDNSHALAWNNGLRRCLVDLGLKARAPMSRETDLSDWVTRQARNALVP
jgi:hypothetical protein